MSRPVPRLPVSLLRRGPGLGPGRAAIRALILSTVLAVVALAAGCSSRRAKPESAPSPVPATKNAPAPSRPEEPGPWPYGDAVGLPDGYRPLRILQVITFPAGSSSLDSEARGALGETARRLEKNPSWRLAILGFADARGEKARAQKLSAARAGAAAAYLAARGLDRERLHTRGLGAAYARAGRYERVQLEQDRRVEIWALVR